MTVANLVDSHTGEIFALDHISSLQKTVGFCPYRAPLAALVFDGKSVIRQTCCNHWDCPVCRFALAAQVRARIVGGAFTLASEGRALYFWTFTCRGKELDLETADDSYYEWTNRALANLRAKCKLMDGFWSYVQVTERQKRGAAHSHFVHTFCPSDAVAMPGRGGHFQMISAQFTQAVVRSGLGVQCEMTLIDTPEAVGHYISGYLNKHVSVDVFPRKWKRVRYSRNWPKLPVRTFEYALTLVNRRAWDKLDKSHRMFETDDELTYKYAQLHCHNVTRSEALKMRNTDFAS